MKIALLGNPNTGKSSVFNMLTGLRQHVGNFPGVTVDKKSGFVEVNSNKYTLIDFPGTYSLYPRSKDEQVVYNALCDKTDAHHPDAVAIVIDASNLKRNLLLCSQLYDLEIPMIIIVNMVDVASRQNIEINIERLREIFKDATVLESNARIKLGKDQILNSFEHLKARTGHRFQEKFEVADMEDSEAQEKETQYRFEIINNQIDSIISHKEKKDEQRKLDKILTHKVFGYLIFAVVLMIIFQFVYSIASFPMDIIDGAFANLSEWTRTMMSPGILTDLITQGIIPGIGGVVIFIPQIALLFFFIAVLEETGYLARVVFIMDRLMRPLGLNGKSIVPLLSSAACAIPGVMSTRTISDWKERMITIMVAPLMSCSARIPVYTLLIALVIPQTKWLGIFNLQGLVLFALYGLGTVAALLTAVVLRMFIKAKKKGFLLLEIPDMKAPHWRNVGIVVVEKVRVFVWGAGKIILAISIILWALASFGPGDRMEKAAEHEQKVGKELALSDAEIERNVLAAELKNSYIGIMGQGIEPVIRPLGYDWKIGIALITSFAAREVFVGSMATIYAVEQGDSDEPLIEKMRNAKREDGSPVYTLATGCSLMVFYVLAMQCMATLAVVKRETKSWKWPLLQIAYMGVLAYLGSWLTYVILS